MGRINLCVSDSYFRLTVPAVCHDHVYLFSNSISPWHGRQTRVYVIMCVRVSFKSHAGVFFPLHLVESNLSPGWAHKSCWGGAGDVFCTCNSFTKLIPVVRGCVSVFALLWRQNIVGPICPRRDRSASGAAHTGNIALALRPHRHCGLGAPKWKIGIRLSPPLCFCIDSQNTTFLKLWGHSPASNLRDVKTGCISRGVTF